MSVEIHEIAKKMNGKQLKERVDHVDGVMRERWRLTHHVLEKPGATLKSTLKAGRIYAHIKDKSLPMLEERLKVFKGEGQDDLCALRRLGQIEDTQINLVLAAADFYRGRISQAEMNNLQQAYVKKMEQVIAMPCKEAYSPEGFERRLRQKLNPYRRTEEKPASNS